MLSAGFAATSLAVALSVAAAALEGPAGREAAKGDPARWYRPAETPQAQYENAMQEARAALSEALRECRSESSRAECEADARGRYEDDIERARGLLVRSNLA